MVCLLPSLRLLQQLNWQTSDGKSVIMLLGRDVLSQFLFVHNAKMDTIYAGLLDSPQGPPRPDLRMLS
jgi:hypothetical protein